MHPFYSLYVAETRQAELLREARAAGQAPRRRSRVRTVLGYWLVGLGLRMAVQPRPRPQVAR